MSLQGKRSGAFAYDPRRLYLLASFLAFLLSSPPGSARGQAVDPRAGGGIGDGGPATLAQLDGPARIAVDASGNVFIVEETGHRVRMVDAMTGVITTVAGTGQTETDRFGNVMGGFSGDGGAATSARLNLPSDLVIDTRGNLFFADSFNLRIRKVDATTGTITTVAGTGTTGFAGDDGPATNAQLNFPFGLALDRTGSLFIADSNNHRIRKLDLTTGTITTVAGSGAVGFQAGGFAGDGGPATSARLNRPTSVALDSNGDLFVTDRGNHRIRKVASESGIITTVAGTGQTETDRFGNTFGGFAGDAGPATSARLNFPGGLAIDPSGNLLIADRDNH